MVAVNDLFKKQKAIRFHSSMTDESIYILSDNFDLTDDSKKIVRFLVDAWKNGTETIDSIVEKLWAVGFTLVFDDEYDLSDVYDVIYTITERY